MTPTEQQKAILECRENLVVIAAPGSGKTFVLSEKIKNDIKELLDYQGIIAISYTNKASLELKNRSLANGISPKSSFFGTIDKFCIQDIIIPFGSLMQEKKTFDNLIIRSMNNSERSQLGQVEKREKIEYNHMDIILSLLEENIIDTKELENEIQQLNKNIRAEIDKIHDEKKGSISIQKKPMSKTNCECTLFFPCCYPPKLYN